MTENPLEQEVLAMVREMREREQASWTLITRYLDKRGNRIRNGGKFNRQRIYHLARKAGIK